MKIHLGVEKDFVPANKAHPALMVDDRAGPESALKKMFFELRIW